MANRVSKHSRRNPTSKNYSERVNKAADTPHMHQANLHIKLACYRQLINGELVPIRREHNAEWKDGHLLVSLLLVECLAMSDDRKTMWIQITRPINEELRTQIAKALKGNTFTGRHISLHNVKDRTHNFEFEPTSNKQYYGDEHGQFVNMATTRRKK